MFYDKKTAILLQNAFTTLGKIILENFKNLLKSKGINLFFTDIDKIKKQMEDELK